jgi:hypothetical protein
VEKIASALFVVVAERGARLHRHTGDTLDPGLERHDVSRIRKRLVGRSSITDLCVDQDVGARFIPQAWRRRLRGLRGVSRGRKHLVVDLDKLRSVLGDRQRLRHHQRHPFADVTNFVDRERIVGCLQQRAVAVNQHDIRQPPLRLIRHSGRSIGRDRLHAVGFEIGAGEHGKHALERLRAFGRDALDPCVGVTGAEHKSPRLARQIDVVAELAGAHHQTRVLLAANGLSNSSLHCYLLCAPIHRV